jgi:ADP-ribosylglycohydrolase
MIGGGLGGWDRGEWTDDTQMALCIAEEAATGHLDPRAVAGRFLDWYRSGPADVGAQTGAVLSRASAPGDVAPAAERYFSNNPHNSAGNGSLMRTAPVALACLGDDDALVGRAMEIAALTHADPVAGEACAIWCAAIDRAVRHGTGVLEGVREGTALLPAARRAYWGERIDEAVAGPPSSFAPNTFVVRAFQAALAAILHTPVPAEMPCRHLQAALQCAVSIGNDTDTVAAIAGAWLGARWGASAVPAEWSLLLHGWPGYSSRDLVRLAVLSAKRGQSDRAGWPAADDLVSHYRHHWYVAPMAKPLAEDEGLVMANVDGAVRAGADITVSLCRMGRADLTGRRALDVRLVDEDDPAANPNLDFVLQDLARAIIVWRAAGNTVLIHCVMAERRTPAVAAAYLGERFGIPGREALKRVFAQLPGAHENPAFSAALARLWPAVTGGPGHVAAKDAKPHLTPDDSGKARDGEEVAIAAALFGEGGEAGNGFRPVCLEDLETRLADVLELMAGSPSRWILIIETAGGRYVQFLASEEGALVSECVSNSYLSDASKLSEDDEELLAELGWGWPSLPKQLNWRTIESELGATIDSAVLALHTLRRVFGCRDGDSVQVKLFRYVAPGPTKTRRVCLRVEHNSEGSRYLDAYLDNEGALRLDGHDLGPGTALISSDGEYEYFKKIAATDIPALLELLKAPAGADILDVLEVNWSGSESYELERLVGESGIPVEFTSWSG